MASVTETSNIRQNCGQLLVRGNEIFIEIKINALTSANHTKLIIKPSHNDGNVSNLVLANDDEPGILKDVEQLTFRSFQQIVVDQKL